MGATDAWTFLSSLAATEDTFWGWSRRLVKYCGGRRGVLQPLSPSPRARTQAGHAQRAHPLECSQSSQSHLGGRHEKIPGEQGPQTQHEEDNPDSFVPGGGRGKRSHTTQSHLLSQIKPGEARPSPTLCLQLSQGTACAFASTCLRPPVGGVGEVFWDREKGPAESTEGGGPGTQG